MVWRNECIPIFDLPSVLIPALLRYPVKILYNAYGVEIYGEGFENICEALKEIAQKGEDVNIVYPVHLNPNVQKPVKTILTGIDKKRKTAFINNDKLITEYQKIKNLKLVCERKYDKLI